MTNFTQQDNDTFLASASKQGMITTNLDLLVAISVILTVIATFTAFANIIVIIALVKSLIHDRSNNNRNNAGITKVLMASMAVTDAIIGVFIMPLAIYDFITNGKWALGAHVNMIRFAIQMLLTCVSIYHVVFMAIERYLGVCKPLLHRTLSTRTGYVMVGVCWMLPTIITVVASHFSTNIKPPETGKLRSDQGVFQDVNGLAMSYDSMSMGVCLTLAFYIPFVTMFIFYGRVLVEVRKFHRRQNVRRAVYNNITKRQHKPDPRPPIRSVMCLPEDGDNETDVTYGIHLEVGQLSVPVEPSTPAKSEIITVIMSENQLNNQQWKQASDRSTTFTTNTTASENSRPTSDGNNLKAVKTIVSIVICFAICWLPFSVFSIMAMFSYPYPTWLMLLSAWMGLVNSTINPVLYCRHKIVRQIVRDFICSSHI